MASKRIPPAKEPSNQINKDHIEPRPMLSRDQHVELAIGLDHLQERLEKLADLPEGGMVLNPGIVLAIDSLRKAANHFSEAHTYLLDVKGQLGGEHVPVPDPKSELHAIEMADEDAESGERLCGRSIFALLSLFLPFPKLRSESRAEGVRE